MSVSTYPVLFESAMLSDSNATIYTVPSLTGTVLRGLRLKLTNVTAATRLVTIYASTSGTESTTNAVLYNVPVAPYDWIEVDVPRVGAGGVVEGFCDTASSVNVSAIGDSARLFVPGG